MNRRFIDWGRPFLRTVVQVLIDENLNGTTLDLSGFILVFPSSRGLRHFEEQLVREVEKRTAAGTLSPEWFPPETTTIGRLPEHFYTPRKPFAGHTAELLAWSAAFKTIKENNPRGAASLFPSLSETPGFSELTEIAEILSKLHTELASEGFSFSAPAAKISVPQEVERWAILCEVEKEYLALLDRNNLCDKQAERKAAAANQFQTDKTVVLIGTADLNGLLKKILNQIADSLEIFICAPESELENFDEFGSVIPDCWKNRAVPIPENSLVQTTDPAEEGETAALYALKFGQSDSDQPFDPRLVTVSTPDPETIPFLTAALSDLGIPAEFGGGTPASENRVFRLLRSAADYLRTNTFNDFAAWVRHPDVEKKISQIFPDLKEKDWLSPLDRCQNNYVPQTFLLSRVPAGLSKDETETLRLLLSAAEKLLAPLRDTEPVSSHPLPQDPENSAEAIESILKHAELPDSLTGKERPITEYPEKVSAFFENFYANTDNSEEAERQIDEGVTLFHRIFDELVLIPNEMAPSLFADQALEFLLKLTSSSRIPAGHTERSLEMIGWLDAFFDEAPNLVVAGLNDGILPKTQTGDLFLPNTARQKLVLEDNNRRFARDTYTLTAITANRNVRLLFARRSMNETPLTPSRILLTGDPIKIAERIEKFFSGTAAASLPEDLCSGTETPAEKQPVKQEQDLFFPPKLRMTHPLPETMRVTDFETFLYSPYRYFLSAALRLETLEDKAAELNAALFGNIIHDILRQFGQNESVRDSADEKEIAAFLTAALDKYVQSLTQEHPAGTVLIQIEMIQQRLRKFAEWQARWRTKGPRIIFTEVQPQKPIILQGDFTPAALRGRIDRIDYDETHDQWFVFDYKTFDSVDMHETSKGNPPEEADWASRLSPFRKGGEDSAFTLLSLSRKNTVSKKHRSNTVKKIGFEIGDETSGTDEGWINLQLPIYAEIAERIIAENRLHRGENRIALGYITLPKSDSVRALIGSWSPEELEDAWNTAGWVRKMIERLWKTEIDPKAPADPEFPEWGTILRGSGNARLYELRDFVLE